MATRQMASRPKLLRSNPDELDATPDPDDDQITADELDAARRARDARAAAAPAKKAAATKRTTTSAKKPAAAKPAAVVDPARDGAGVLLGFFAYAVFVAYIRGGWSGVWEWLAAKFINKTPASSSQQFDPFAPHHGPGGSTLTPIAGAPGPGIRSHVTPGPGDNQPQPNGPGGTVILQ